jgi:hypothetical protein
LLPLHPTAEAVSAVLGQDIGAVMPTVALAVARDDQLGESGDRAVRVVDSDDGVQQILQEVFRPRILTIAQCNCPRGPVGQGGDEVSVACFIADLRTFYRYHTRSAARSSA